MDSILSRGRKAATFHNSNTFNIYIDGILGDDANDGLSPTPSPNGVGPLATIDGVYSVMPLASFSNSSVVLNFASNGSLTQTYNINDSMYIPGGKTINAGFSFNGPNMVPAILTTGPSTAALDVVPAVEVSLNNASGVATPLRTRLDFTTAAPGWTVDDMAGRYFVRIKRAGVKHYFELPVSGNTASSIYVDSTSATAPGVLFGPANGAIVGDLLATDTVEIVQPGAILQGIFGFCSYIGAGSPVSPFALLFSFGPAAFTKLGLSGIQAMSIPATLDRCAFNGLAGFLGIHGGMANCAARNSLVSIVTNNSVHGGVHSVDTVTNAGPSVALAGYNTTMTAGWSSDGAGAFSPEGAGVMYFNLPVGMWKCTPTSHAAQYSAGVQAYTPGTALMFGSSLVGNIDTATSPGAVAIKAGFDGKVIVNSNVLAMIGDPAAGDLKVQAGAAVHYGTGAGQYKEAAGYNGHFTRVLENTGDTSRITDQPLV